MVHGGKSACLVRPVAGAALVLALAGSLGGCGGKKAAVVDDRDEGVNVGLEQLLAESGDSTTSPVDADAPPPPAEDLAEYAALVAEGAASIDDALAALDGQAWPVGPPDAGDSSAAAGGQTPITIALDDLMEDGAGGESDEPVEPAPEDPAEAELDRDALLGQLEASLNRELASESEPFRTALTLVALAAAQGEDPQSVIAADAPAGSKLSPSERDAAGAIAELLGTLLSPTATTAEERTAVLDSLSTRLSSQLGVSIPVANLCTRVSGFGRYQPFSSTTFLAGRGVHAIVYVEIARFSHRELQEDGLAGLAREDRWAVEMSQELRLTHKADGRLAWKMPAEKVVETSRNRLRDFYLITEVRLPPTLSVGDYELKVTVRDEVSESVAEAVIPIAVVVDPALAWQGG